MWLRVRNYFMVGFAHLLSVCCSNFFLLCKCATDNWKQTEYQIMGIQFFSKINPKTPTYNCKKKGFNCFWIAVSACGRSICTLPEKFKCCGFISTRVRIKKTVKRNIFYLILLRFFSDSGRKHRISFPLHSIHIVRLKCELLLFGIRSIDDGYCIYLFDRSTLKMWMR